MTDDPFRCICDPGDLFEPPDPTPRAVEGCPAHKARRAAQLFDPCGAALADSDGFCDGRDCQHARLATDTEVS